MPIVEPEVLTDGDHDIEACARKTSQVLSSVMQALRAHPGVLVSGLLLKPNMVTPGNNGPAASAKQVCIYKYMCVLPLIPKMQHLGPLPCFSVCTLGTMRVIILQGTAVDFDQCV